MLKSGGVRCKYFNEGIYIPSMGNLRGVIKWHEDKCPDNPHRETTKEDEIMSECPTCKGTGWIWSIEIPGLRKRCECCGGTGQKRSCEG